VSQGKKELLFSGLQIIYLKFFSVEKVGTCKGIAHRGVEAEALELVTR
jgi:hypothetical protein